MSLNYDDAKYSKWVYLPKQGETAIFDIDTIEEVKVSDPKNRFQFVSTEKVELPDGTEAEKKTPLGYCIRAMLKDGRELTITSLGAFNKTFRAFRIQDGDKVKITHKDRGEWVVEFLSRAQTLREAIESQDEAI
jgi:hypothetical protein